MHTDPEGCGNRDCEGRAAMLLDMPEFPAGLGPAKLVAPLWFFLCWIGYAPYADRQRAQRNTLAARVHEYRLAWMQQMLARENRTVALAILRLLLQNISFFASGAVLILGGLVAVFGSGEKAMQVIRHIPFAQQVPPTVWDLEVLLVVYRRQFRSHMLGMLGRIGEPVIPADANPPQPPQPSRDNPFSSSARR